VLLWAPLKDLETLDRLSRDVEALGARGFIAETRLRPPMNPMKMNGCAMIVLNDPPGLEAEAGAASAWVAGTLGEAGASARLRRFGG
jgi:23S rRNA (adenine2030-N6)-methyltransferase